METKSGVIYLDTSSYRVIYESTYEHIEAEVADDPQNSLSRYSNGYINYRS